MHQVSFLIKSRAEGKRGILLRSTTSRGTAWTTSLAGRFAPTPAAPSAIRRTDAYEGGSDAERVGGRRKKCFSLREDEEGTGAEAGMAGIGIERQSSTPAPPPPPLSLFACCVLVRYEGLLVAVVVAATMLGTSAPDDVTSPPPYKGSGGALGYDGCDLDSNEDGVVRAPNTGAAADLDFKTGNADFIGMRDFGATACASLASGLAFDSVG